MAEFASWFKTKDGYIFLTDDEVYAYQDQEGIDDENINWFNLVGHAGIIRVFNIADKHHHYEGFVGMPTVIKKNLFDGRMDMLFGHAGNLREATPEFIPTMKRLANRFPSVEDQLQRNPYKHYLGRTFSYKEQMEIGVANGFNGSTIGELLRHPDCDQDSMIVALQGAVSYLEAHSDHHHYFDIIRHPNVTKKVLQYIVGHVKHKDVTDVALEALKNPSVKKTVRKAKDYRKMTEKVEKYKEGQALVRTIA
jgi:hypothetical protein